MRKKFTILTAIMSVVVLFGVGMWLGMRADPYAGVPKQPVVMPKTSTPDAKVASAQTTRQPTALPKDRSIALVVSDGQQRKVISSEGAHDEGEQVDGPVPQQPGTPPSSPPPKTPQTVTINLSGPLTATLLPGQRTSILTYELTDGRQFEWFPGESTGWIDTVKQPGSPVWSTVLERQPSQPHISNHVHFFITADPKAKPGVYKVSVKMRLTPLVVLGVPVMVTVPSAPAAAAQPG